MSIDLREHLSTLVSPFDRPVEISTKGDELLHDVNGWTLMRKFDGKAESAKHALELIGISTGDPHPECDWLFALTPKVSQVFLRRNWFRVYVVYRERGVKVERVLQ